MKTLAVIPARYKSSRFPGKPLMDICGKPMVWWVYQEACKVKEFDDIVIATEDQRIVDACESMGMKVLLTADTHPTGTDRVAEVAQKIEADLYVIIMGDEPLISASDELKLVNSINNDSADAIMLAERFSEPVDVVNTTTIKLAINDDGDLIFMSRSPIPFPKESLGFSYYKNVGCYAIRKDALDFFLRTSPGFCERAEGIELLRLIENHKHVKTVLSEYISMSVDTVKDLERIRNIMAQRF